MHRSKIAYRTVKSMSPEAVLLTVVKERPLKSPEVYEKVGSPRPTQIRTREWRIPEKWFSPVVNQGGKSRICVPAM